MSPATDTKEIWEKALGEIELLVSKANFSTWFRNTRIVRFDGGTIELGVQNEFVKEWLANKYHSTILKTLRNIAEDIRGIE